MNNRARLAALAAAAAIPLALVPAGLANAYSNGYPDNGYEEVTGSQGCTPGYWKNHSSAWQGYAPSQSLSSVFSATPAAYASTTLLQGLSFGGGNGVDGASRILLRAAVAAVLNAAHDDVAYAFTSTQVISRVNAALASGNRSTILTLATELDVANNGGCTL
ncbi:hypothetical protein [Blastococcus sp. PRF04-17]|uniref:hypothetical protein n=1 Tax=Blastococcus sp. PRF04-17 TaxID=2933797 RepID=UPI001FF3EB25|nr:hypothetical protein [Blastococcus sp. PRF04-17]UOY03412.1 hypothetical protein MVA48_08810 [Blastococcus sp. PRF04-17]